MTKTQSRIKRQGLTQSRQREWADIAHLVYLDELMKNSTLSCRELIFHGGTNLHLSWSSPRFSEDLDFLFLNSMTEDLKKIMGQVERRVGERLRAMDAGFKVEFRERTRDPETRLQWHIVVSHVGYIGNSMVKAEFSLVEQSYLDGIETVLRTPVKPGDLLARVTQPAPVATLRAAYCDKLTALATRPDLKWRDVFDLWWIATQSRAIADPMEVLDTLKHHLKAFPTPKGLSVSESLRRYAVLGKKDIVALADPDLKRWVPALLWDRLWPDTIGEMTDYLLDTTEQIAAALDQDGGSPTP